jgi:hypothetical protein
MKIAVIVARIQMGLVFVFFGLNGFLQFIKAPMPTGLAGQARMERQFVPHFSWVLLLAKRHLSLAAGRWPEARSLIVYHAIFGATALQ